MTSAPPSVADVYRRFADVEAHGISDVFFAWARGIADDPEVVALIERLPPAKRQPNLVFAAARFCGAPIGAYPALHDWLITHWGEVEKVALSRATQTNEAGRCSVLLPVLSRIPGRLALIEAGASAGLCLYPDRYSYRYDTGQGEAILLDPAAGPSSVELTCTIDTASAPEHLPDVAWRGGVDLNPLDVRDEDELAWLETLVWPEHDTRRRRLRAAAELVSNDPPRIVRGDILAEIPALVDAAPPEARVVVFHSAVLVYLGPRHRADFADLMHSLPDVTWISNEGAGVLPGLPESVRAGANGRTIVSVDGEPVAYAGPHGQSYESL